MRNVFVIGLVSLVGGGASAVTQALFLDPPDDAQPLVRCGWQNGLVTKAGITAELEAFKRIGICGETIIYDSYGEKGPVSFMDETYFDVMAHTDREAKRLGLRIGVHNCAGWSSSGGPWVPVEDSMKKLTFSECSVTGGQRVAVSLREPPKRDGFYRDITVIAFPAPDGTAEKISSYEEKSGLGAGWDKRALYPTNAPSVRTEVSSSSVVVLDPFVKDGGQLVWEAPAGQWIVRRIGYTTTARKNAPAPPEGCGYECDKLDASALDAHWRGYMGKLLARLPEKGQRALSWAFIDSYEVGGQNWTRGLFDEFKRRRGYDARPFLPVLAGGAVVDTPEISERFLWDWRKTVSELMNERYYRHFQELCHRDGLKSMIEPYGCGPFSEEAALESSDILLGEFWQGGSVPEGGMTFGNLSVISGLAHVAGVRCVAAESFTADERVARWTVDPYDMKPFADCALTEGLNLFVLGAVPHQPYSNLKPGMTIGPWENQFGPHNTWWLQARPMILDFQRCQYMLREGMPVKDACLFLGEAISQPSTLWFRYRPRVRLPGWVTYDVCQEGALLKRFSVDRSGDLLLPDGVRYRYLLLQDEPALSPDVLHKIEALVRAGATVIATPTPPRHATTLSDYPACDRAVAASVEALWGRDGKGGRRGQGRFAVTDDPAAVFAADGVKPDFACEPASPMAKMIHRRDGELDFYFVANLEKETRTRRCVFRIHGKSPELWDPLTGETRLAPVWREKEDGIEIPLTFAPAGSIFVVFSPAAGARSPAHLTSADFTDADLEAAAVKQILHDAEGMTISQFSARLYDGKGREIGDVTSALRGNTDRRCLPYRFFFERDSFNKFKDKKPVRLTVRYRYLGRDCETSVATNNVLHIPDPTAVQPQRVDPTVVARSPGELSLAGDSVTLVPWRKGVWSFSKGGDTFSLSVGGAKVRKVFDGGWTVRFGGVFGTPPCVPFERLVSWTERNEPGVRYFSGTAVYEKSFELTEAERKSGDVWKLDLGRVKNLAEVSLNGVPLGALWCPPFEVDATRALKAGMNRLSVKVTNLWPNRLIGDAQLPDDVEWKPDFRGMSVARIPEWAKKGEPSPTGRVTFSLWKHWDRDDALLESGLLGPVRLEGTRRIVCENTPKKGGIAE